MLGLGSDQPEIHKLDYGEALWDLPRCRKWVEVAGVEANLDLPSGKLLFSQLLCDPSALGKRHMFRIVKRQNYVLFLVVQHTPYVMPKLDGIIKGRWSGNSRRRLCRGRHLQDIIE
jgi:hypothetical protein